MKFKSAVYDFMQRAYCTVHFSFVLFMKPFYHTIGNSTLHHYHAILKYRDYSDIEWIVQH